MMSLKWLAWSVLCVPLMLGPAIGAQEGQPNNGQPTTEQTDPGQEQPGPAEQKEAEPNGSPFDREAMVALQRMAETLAQAKGFSVTIQSSYDAVQESGQKITFGERRNILLSRPDQLRIEAEESDGKRTLVVYDGKAVTVLDRDRNVYGQVDKQGSVDDVVRYVIRNMGIRLPLALLLVTTLPDELEARLQSLDYVERDTLTPVPTDHLAAQTDEVDFEVWLTPGETPLPQRVVITYKNDDGEPQYRAEFSEWQLNPDMSPANLAFSLPEGAERIPVLVRVRRPKADPPPSTAEAAGAETPEVPDSREGPTK